VVEVAPPYDVSDMTALLACRAVMDVLGTLVSEGKLGKRKAATRVGNTRTPARAASRTASR
jgi:agmatinase